MLGCTKQNISYWSIHFGSTQAKKSVYEVIRKSAGLFKLSADEAESLANSAGLSLHFEGGDLFEHLGYSGMNSVLCNDASVSDRMLRNSRRSIPTKQTLIALAVALENNCDEVDSLLRKYGYCLSDSVVGDIVVKWYLTEYHSITDRSVLHEINETLSAMGLPLLMTRLK